MYSLWYAIIKRFQREKSQSSFISLLLTEEFSRRQQAFQKECIAPSFISAWQPPPPTTFLLSSTSEMFCTPPVFWRTLLPIYFFFSKSEIRAYQPGPWCGSAQTAEQNCSHCPSRRHPSDCWRRCTAVGFQCCRNLSLPLSSSWVFSLASPHHQILLKTLCQRKTHKNNHLDGTRLLKESRKRHAQEFWSQKSLTFTWRQAQEQVRYHPLLQRTNILKRWNALPKPEALLHTHSQNCHVQLHKAEHGWNGAAKHFHNCHFQKHTIGFRDLWVLAKAYGAVDNSAEKNLKHKDNLNTIPKWCKYWWKKNTDS